jgi:hypothetical protein
MSQPKLSAVLVVGEQRERARGTIEAIAAQTAVDSIELILVDLCPEAPRVPEPRSPRTSQVVLPPSTPWGSVRAAGVRAARSPIVAFLEDHVTPNPGWAEALLQAHRAPWAAVGYAFLAGDQRWSSRATLIAEYGPWAHPAAGGPSRLLPGNNISYKRDTLLALGGALDRALEIDNNLHRRFAAMGLEGAVEPRALVRHHELAGVWQAASANHSYNRLLASGVARDEDWPLPRRVLYSIAAPIGAPVMRAARLARSLLGRRSLWRQAAMAMPVAGVIWFWSGVGQALGYLFGRGDAERRLIAWELGARRASSGNAGSSADAGAARPAA